MHTTINGEAEEGRSRRVREEGCGCATVNRSIRTIGRAERVPEQLRTEAQRWDAYQGARRAGEQADAGHFSGPWCAESTVLRSREDESVRWLASIADDCLSAVRHRAWIGECRVCAATDSQCGRRRWFGCALNRRPTRREPPTVARKAQGTHSDTRGAVSVRATTNFNEEGGRRSDNITSPRSRTCDSQIDRRVTFARMHPSSWDLVRGAPACKALAMR